MARKDYFSRYLEGGEKKKVFELPPLRAIEAPEPALQLDQKTPITEAHYATLNPNTPAINPPPETAKAPLRETDRHFLSLKSSTRPLLSYKTQINTVNFQAAECCNEDDGLKCPVDI